MLKKDKSGFVQNALFLFCILLNKNMTKQEIILEFQKKGIKVSRTSVDNYIAAIIESGICVEIKKDKGKNIYSISKEPIKCTLDDECDAILQELKKVIIAQKNYFNIKNAVYLFYKISSCFVCDDNQKVANFGYYSTINWFLVNKLEKHCFNKDVIVIEYVLPDGRNKEVLIHTDKLVVQGNSNRLYLSGTIGKSFQFSHLPVDRIFMIKKVIRKKACFDLSVKLLKYTVSKRAFELSGLENNEVIFSEDKDKITILTPVVDEFSVVQHLLHYCPDVYYISDEKIKAMVVDKLKNLEKIYEK